MITLKNAVPLYAQKLHGVAHGLTKVKQEHAMSHRLHGVSQWLHNLMIAKRLLGVLSHVFHKGYAGLYTGCWGLYRGCTRFHKVTHSCKKVARGCARLHIRCHTWFPNGCTKDAHAMLHVVAQCEQKGCTGLYKVLKNSVCVTRAFTKVTRGCTWAVTYGFTKDTRGVTRGCTKGCKKVTRGDTRWLTGLLMRFHTLFHKGYTGLNKASPCPSTRGFTKVTQDCTTVAQRLYLRYHTWFH